MRYDISHQKLEREMRNNWGLFVFDMVFSSEVTQDLKDMNKEKCLRGFGKFMDSIYLLNIGN